MLGFKAQIVKLNGEKDHEKQKQSDMSRVRQVINTYLYCLNFCVVKDFGICKYYHHKNYL